MNSEALFEMALGLGNPWRIESVEFREGGEVGNELHIRLDFERGAKFPDNASVPCGVHDTVEREWQHLNFFEHACFLHARVPRIRTSAGRVETVKVPWSRPNSGFSLMFEAFAMALIEREMSISRVAEVMGVNPQRIWTLFKHWVCEGRKADDPSRITKLGVDETSSRKGQTYITVGVDMDERRVIHATPGKGKETLFDIQRYLASQEVKAEQIEHLSMDLSPAFISGGMKAFPKAKITFDRFHVVKLLNEAMDTVRKQEAKEHAFLKNQKYNFLRHFNDLSEKRQKQVSDAITLYPTLGEAYRLKVLFNDLWTMPDPKSARAFMDDWMAQVETAGIQAFKRFSKTVKAHWSGIVRFLETGLTNALLEAINHKIQLAKRRARGFRNIDNFINMIYFLCGRLNFSYPRYFT